MDQFRHIGEVLGSLKALMVLKEDIQINQRQCSLILEILNLAFETISEEIRQNLKLEERQTKWKALDEPLRELYRVFKEGELYIRNSLDSKDWLGKVISLYQNNDCIEFHIHNLLSHFPAVIEAIENAGEISGLDRDEMQKRTALLSKKYEKEWNDPTLFQWRYGKQYLIPHHICRLLESSWKEDRWGLIEKLRERKASAGVSWTKNERRLAEFLLRRLLDDPSEQFHGKLFPSSILLGSKDYQVRRRLGGSSQYKEIQWFGESFALRHFFGEVETLDREASTLLSLSHPNILQYLCGFVDEERKEFFLVMELMNKDLTNYLKENCGPRRKILFSLSVAVDLMLQIARGMEYLHSRKIYHGDLSPSNVLLKQRNSSEGYFQAKITGFGLSSIKQEGTRISTKQGTRQEEVARNSYVCYAPEVIAEEEQKPGSTSPFRFTEKADVYSFAMLSFELLTGKVPFEDNHLKGEKTSLNIKAGERPLFPYPSPKYLVSLIKKCWQTDPVQRPSFSSICRILRYIKKYLSMNPDHIEPGFHSSAPVDYCEIEAMFVRKFPEQKAACESPKVSQIPFQMFAYRVGEREKNSPKAKEKGCCESVITDDASVWRDETASLIEDPFLLATETRSVCWDNRSFCDDVKSVFSEAPGRKIIAIKRLPSLPTVRVKKSQVARRTSTTPKAATPIASTPKTATPKTLTPKRVMMPRGLAPKAGNPKAGTRRELSPKPRAKMASKPWTLKSQTPGTSPLNPSCRSMKMQMKMETGSQTPLRMSMSSNNLSRRRTTGSVSDSEIS